MVLGGKWEVVVAITNRQGQGMPPGTMPDRRLCDSQSQCGHLLRTWLGPDRGREEGRWDGLPQSGNGGWRRRWGGR